MKSKSFYVYAHKSHDGRVFYIGKGTGKRAWATARRSVRWQRHAEKHGLCVHIVQRNMPEPCAFTLEKILISQIGMKNLCNMTTGGEGTSGRVPSKEQREKCRMKNKGKIPHQSTKAAAKKKNSKPVGTTCGLRFNSLTDAARFVCIDGKIEAAKTSISACCRGKRVGRCYGYEFRYVIDGELLDSGFQPKKVGKPVKTDCGLEFSSGSAARDWLRSNGFPKAINSNITQCCKGRVISAYGYKWSYK